MTIFWILMAVILAVAGIAFLVQGSRKAKSGAGQSTRTDPFRNVSGAQNFSPEVLGPGAIVTHGATDYVVRGTLAFKQGYYQWWEHLLDGGDGSQWLSVEVDEGQLNLGWWTSRSDLSLEPTAEVSVDGVRYRRSESGEANFTSEGTTGLPESGCAVYQDYEEVGGDRLLGFEQFGDGGSEVSTGRTILPGEVTIYPAPRG